MSDGNVSRGTPIDVFVDDNAALSLGNGVVVELHGVAALIGRLLLLLELWRVMVASSVDER